MYAESTAVLGPLSVYAEPHSYDLCALHAERLTVPRGWEVLRLALPAQPPTPNPDDLLALADAVREAARPAPEPEQVHRHARGPLEPPENPGTRRGHLRILREQS